LTSLKFKFSGGIITKREFKAPSVVKGDDYILSVKQPEWQ
jgi:hypothetical protein